MVGFQRIGVGFSWLGNFDVLRSCDHSGGGGGNFECPIPKILSSRVPVCIFGKRPSRICRYILRS